MNQQQNELLVAVRVRPLNAKERSISEFHSVQLLYKQTITLIESEPNLDESNVSQRKNRNKEFKFDSVYDIRASQQAVYEGTTQFLIESVLDGYNATIFSYGATGSGKTYTMVGSQQDLGIMPRAMQSLFQMVSGAGSFKEIGIKVSYYEIYNEIIRDLLTSEDKALDIREDKSGGVIIVGISEVETKTVPEVMSLLKIGNKNRAMEATEFNSKSSRSHAILQVSIEVKERNQGVNEQIILSKLCLVDLAGSERAANTNNKGQRLVEGAKINQSLLVLGNCIQALAEAQEKNIQKPFIPYRNSKLTRLLKDSLGGNCRTVMIANVSPALASFEETNNTLIYANRAKSIKTLVNRNVLNQVNHISSYEEIIKNLRIENEELKQLMQNNQKQLPQKIQVAVSPNQDQKIINYFNDLKEIKKSINQLQEREETFKNNLNVLQTTSNRTSDKLDQIRLKERIDNCSRHIEGIGYQLRDLYRKSDEMIKQKGSLLKMIDQNEDSRLQNQLIAVFRQGELQIENMKIKENDYQNVKPLILKELKNGSTKNQLKMIYQQNNQKDSLPVIQKQNKNLRPSIVPGVNQPFPISSQQYQMNKLSTKKLKLPDLIIVKPVRIKQYQANQQKQQLSNKNLNNVPRDRLNTSVQVPRSSATNIRNDVNRSLDPSQHDMADFTETPKKNLSKDQRFQSAMNGKKNQSQLNLKSKILNGRANDSPYLSNFKSQEIMINDSESKKFRLKKLNINIKEKLQSVG